MNLHDNGAISEESQRAFAASLPARPCLVAAEPLIPPPHLREELPPPPSAWEPLGDTRWWNDVGP